MYMCVCTSMSNSQAIENNSEYVIPPNEPREVKKWGNVALTPIIKKKSHSDKEKHFKSASSFNLRSLHILLVSSSLASRVLNDED